MACSISLRANTGLPMFGCQEGLMGVSYIEFSADFKNAILTNVILTNFLIQAFFKMAADKIDRF